MKNIFKFLGIIALAAVIGFSMAACSSGGGVGAPGLPENAASAAELPKFNSTFVESEDDVKTLLAFALGSWSGSDTLWSIQAADVIITGKALGVKYTAGAAYTNGYFHDKDRATFLSKYLGEKEAEFEAEYTGATYTYYDEENGGQANYTKVTLDGSAGQEISSNVAFGKIFDWNGINNTSWVHERDGYWGNAGKNITEGDWTEFLNSFDKKIAVKYVTGETAGGTYTGLVEGKIVTEGNCSWKKVIAKAPQYKDGVQIKKEEVVEDNSEDYTVAVALTIDNGTHGAKIIFTFAQEEGSQMFDPRAGETTRGQSYSSIEVYNNANEKKFDIQLNTEEYARPIFWNVSQMQKPF